MEQDFYDLEDGIYLALYDETGTFLFGRVPYGFQEKTVFADGSMQTVGTGARGGMFLISSIGRENFRTCISGVSVPLIVQKTV